MKTVADILKETAKQELEINFDNSNYKIRLHYLKNGFTKLEEKPYEYADLKIICELVDLNDFTH